MRADVSCDGPGPMILRVDPDGDVVPVGSALIDFYSEHAELSIVADNAALEAVIRARIDAWALEHVASLLPRLMSQHPAGAGCQGRCACRGSHR